MSILDTATSGLSASQTALSVTANNLANADTIGFKSSHALFQSLYEQTVQGGTAPTATSGGTDPIQTPGGSAVGLGTNQVNFSQGGIESTSIPSNVALSGAGWFVVNTPQGHEYTRAGDFTVNAQGGLVDPNGNTVMGWPTNTVAGGTQSGANMTALTIPIGQQQTPSATTTATLSGNINASAVGTTTASTTTKTIPVTLYDTQGNALQEDMVFSNPTAASGGGVQWTVNLEAQGSTTPIGTSGTIVFATGKAPAWTTAPTWTVTPTDGSPAITFALTNANIANLTSFASSTTATAAANGYPAGTLTSYSVGTNGIITGTYNNGQNATLGQIAVATFPNNNGLASAGNSDWTASAAAGTPSIGQADSGGRGSIMGSSLEQSNVNLSTEFVRLVTAQSNYAANAKVLTVDQANRNTILQSIQ